MLKRRIIPKLLVQPSAQNANRMALVTTVRFSQSVEVGNPTSQAKVFQAQLADELLFLNIRPHQHTLEQLTKLMEQVCAEVFMPFTAGGGVRRIEDIRALLSAGADKVSVNTAALSDPTFVKKAAASFGSQCIVASIDYAQTEHGIRVMTDGGRTPTKHDPVTWARTMEDVGAGEILLTSIDRDGSGHGLDLNMSQAVADAISIPLILSGGCGKARHFIEGLTEGKAEAVAAGTFFCMQDQNLMETRAHVANANVAVRSVT